jgi:hypothetical protein
MKINIAQEKHMKTFLTKLFDFILKAVLVLLKFLVIDLFLSNNKEDEAENDAYTYPRGYYGNKTDFEKWSANSAHETRDKV